MPLTSIPKGATKEEREKIVSKNIKTEVDAGRPQKQAVAIALEKERTDMEKKMSADEMVTSVDDNKAQEFKTMHGSPIPEAPVNPVTPEDFVAPVGAYKLKRDAGIEGKMPE